jgi:hypothetical protein
VKSASIHLGGSLLPPNAVRGKEYSHDLDADVTPIPDPQQIIAWDGVGGVANGLDYSTMRPSYPPDDQMDALAHHLDGFFAQLLDETAHLIFSVDDEATGLFVGAPAPVPYLIPSAGLIPLIGGQSIGGAGELSYELGTAFGASPGSQGLWASQAQINNMPLPVDVDGLEMWGDEPPFTGDTDKYSLEGDLGPVGGPRVSVWNGSGSVYIPHAMIVGAVTGLLGDVPTSSNVGIDLDALMVFDTAGTNDTFERDSMTSAIDQILFSIRQIPDPADATGYYATGSEVFLLNAAGVATYLRHGGHDWDKPWAIANMATFAPGPGGALRVQLDLNALEANVAPEPASFVLMVIAALGFAGRRRRQC